MIYFVSDEHYFHSNIIKYCKRPFDSFEKMNKKMIENHNNLVTDEDTVIHLGDISAGLKGRVKELSSIIKSLKGTHHLIRGNHDHCTDDEYKEMGFVDIKEYLEIDDWFICHYPLNMQVRPDWINDKERELNEIFKKSNCTKIIHGHTHVEDFGLHRFNVAVDLNSFTPVNIATIKEELENIHLRKARRLF